MFATASAVNAMAIERVDGAWSIYAEENTQMFFAFQEAKEKVEGEKGNLSPEPTCSRLLTGFHTNTTDLDLDLDVEGHLPMSRFAPGIVQSQARRLKEEKDSKETTFSFYYKTNEDGTGNIFNSGAVQDMCKFEAKVLSWQPDETNWESTISPAATMYGYQEDSEWTCPLLAQSAIDSKVQMMKADIDDKGTKSIYARFVHPSFLSSGVTAYTRSRIQKREAGEKKGDKWQEIVFNQLDSSYGFMHSAYQAEEDRFLPYGSIRVRVSRSDLNELEKMIYPDFAMVGISFVLVFITMYVYMNSCWMAGWAMYQILLSLPIAALKYRILGINYFEFLHVLIVYLVLGIGADDVFVLFDTFRSISKDYPQDENGAYCRDDLFKVMKKTMMRASTAIFNTTFTTTVAFLSASISKVMPMRSCGWFAALCLIENYALTMLFTPFTLIIYHRFFQGTRCCCPPCQYRNEVPVRPKTAYIDEASPKPEEEDKKKKGYLDRFLQDVYIRGMSLQYGPVRPISLAMVVIMLTVAIQGIGWAAALTPPRSVEVWVPHNHMTLELGPWISKHYASPDFENYVQISFYWGIKEYTTDGQDVYKPNEWKEGTVWDDSFDLTKKSSQDAILSVCQKMQTVECKMDGCDSGAAGTLMMTSPKKTYTCFLEDMKDHYNISELPTGSEFITKLKEFRQCADEGKYGSEMCNTDYRESIGFIDNDLKYVSVKMRSVIRNDLPHSKGVDVRDHVDKIVSGWRDALPADMKSLKYSGGGLFASYDLGSELISGLFSGCAISLPVAFLVLLFSTRNVVISFMAVITVGFIVLSVLGFCRSAMDWDLGIGEAIAGVIVIGYSVDYVVHLAHIYCEAKHYGWMKRDERCRFAIENLGSTIFAGAFTTAGSGMVMFFCYFYFFFKMALLITITIMYSFLFALLFFMGMLWLIGPENNFGDLCIPKCERMDKVVPDASQSS